MSTPTSDQPTRAEAADYAGELREIAGMVAQSPDGPLRWKQYRLVAVADYLASLSRRDDAGREKES